MRGGPGFATQAALLKAFPRKPGSRLYRVEFALAGPDPRIALRERAELTTDERANIAKRLARMDRSSPNGPWTRRDAAADRRASPRPAPATSRQSSARSGCRSRPNVRKLKALGLTESLEVGYRLSPRGRAFLDESRSPQLRHPSRARPQGSRRAATRRYTATEATRQTPGRSRNSA